jgi:enamine deaminase RidA (YjgF/YER057c/UK114 family)
MEMRAFSPQSDIALAEACEVSNFSRLLFISGQAPADEYQRVPADYPSQYRLAWANIGRQLKAAEMSFDNLVKATIFLSDRALIAQSKGLRREVLANGR